MVYDVVVIGSGPGGYVAAIRAAQLGLKTACIEKEKTFGGTCLNVGCIPSKALLQSSEHYAFLEKQGREHGIKCDKISFDFKQMMQRKSGVVRELVEGVAGLLSRNKVDTIKGTARFTSLNTLDVNGTVVEARNFIVATGSESTPLPFLPFDEKVVVSSTGALSLKKVPKKMVVVGAGVIGVELASVYSRLGSEVVIVEMLNQICPAMDKVISRGLLMSLRRQGLTFHLGAKVESADVKKTHATLKAKVGDKSLELKADIILVAIGRRPYSKGLGLEEIGVKMTPQGFATVDADFRTSLPHIYAIGDLIEGPMLAHRASDEGMAAAEIVAGQYARVNYMTIPNVIYTHPEVASVGLTEEEAQGLGLKIKVGESAFKGNPRARCSGDIDGFVKIIGEATTGKIVGMHILGAHASELIAEGVVAIEKQATLEEIARVSHAHPTLSEAIKEAALSCLARATHA